MSPQIDQQLARGFRLMCRSIGSVVSLRALEHFENGDFKSLISMKLDPSSYSDPRSFAEDYSVVSFFRKCRLEIPGIDRKAVALSSFWESERQCCATNVRFSRFLSNGLVTLEESVMLDKLAIAKEWISRVLGPLPRNLDGRFGPGATYGDRGKLTTIADKMTSRSTVTDAARCFLDLVKNDAWRRAQYRRSRYSDPETVRGNRFTTVPKDASKDRGICIEPSLNVFFQLPVGRIMKSRLFATGIDLIHGQDLHRRLACQGSRDGSLATIDLSSASDTVSVELVKYLLPREWFELLSALRSPFTLIEGRWVHLQKFSSMGNGYTFELESLIFSALCVACGLSPRTEFHVFGDDIIIPTEAYSSTVSILSFCGFSINKAKSFADGPFRESCGGDFFKGVAVRPYFLKELPYEPQHWISLVNGIRRMGSQNPNADFRYSLYYNVWLRCMEAIPTHIRCLRGPEQLGDLCITDETFNRQWENGIGYVRVYRPIAKPLPWHHWWPEYVLASALYGAGDSRGIIPRGAVSGYKVDRVAFS